MALAWIGLGSNQDDPAARLHEALHRLQQVRGISLRGVSPFYRSPPWGPVPQPDFVNAVAEIDGHLAPEAMLEALLGIERAMGRERGVRWGPRRIDLDLLHMEGCRRDGVGLQLPHPRLAERAFVLRPWLDLRPELVVPGLGPLAALLEKVDCSKLLPLP